MRCWIIKATTGASVLFVMVGLAGFVWIRARPGTLGDTLSILILIEFPFFFFGIFWLAFRLRRVYRNSIEEFATEHPTLSGNLWLGASILFASVLFATMLLLQH